MRKIFNRLLLISAAVGLIALVGCGGFPTDQIGAAETGIDDLEGTVVPHDLAVMVRSGSPRADLEALFSEAGATVREELPALSAYLVGFDPALRDQVRATLIASVLVEGVLDNKLYDAQKVPDDASYSDQWHLPAIGAPAAWDITTGSEEVLIAVVDTGVDPDHPDLSDKLTVGVSVYDQTDNSRDLNGHGTSVAGVAAAAADNRQGVASVAWANPILPVRVTSERGRTSSWILAAGIREAVSRGAKIVNVSFAPLQEDALVLGQARLARLAGSLVVISSGNTGEEAEGDADDAVIFVGAVDRSDRLAPFSTYGDFVDLTAPGMSILTTKLDGGYGTSFGTSFAAPVVSGVAALLWSVNPSLRPVTVKEILMDTAKDLGSPGRDSSFGEGRVDAQAAVARAREIVEVDDIDAPSVSITAPADGSTVRTDFALIVDADDDYDVADVTLSIDGTVLADDAVPPYAFVLAPSRYASGQHLIKAAATDTSGNSAEHTIVLSFSGPADAERPSVTITNPADGDSVRGLVTVLANVRDNEALESADVLVDGELISTIPLSFSETTARIAYNWNTLDVNLTAGQHDLTIRVSDAAGNQATATVRVNVRK